MRDLLTHFSIAYFRLQAHKARGAQKYAVINECGQHCCAYAALATAKAAQNKIKIPRKIQNKKDPLKKLSAKSAQVPRVHLL